MFDAELYRERAEVEEWKERDPIELFRESLLADGVLTEEAWQSMEGDVGRVNLDTVTREEAAEWEPVEDLERFVYSEVGS